jgi:hypothetical protein
MGLLNEDEPSGIMEGQRAQQHRVHRAGDGGVGSDAERQGQHRDQSEARRFAELPNRVAKIVWRPSHRLIRIRGSKIPYRGEHLKFQWSVRRAD